MSTMALEEPLVQRLILGLQNGLNWSASWTGEVPLFLPTDLDRIILRARSLIQRANEQRERGAAPSEDLHGGSGDNRGTKDRAIFAS